MFTFFLLQFKYISIKNNLVWIKGMASSWEGDHHAVHAHDFFAHTHTHKRVIIYSIWIFTHFYFKCSLREGVILRWIYVTFAQTNVTRLNQHTVSVDTRQFSVAWIFKITHIIRPALYLKKKKKTNNNTILTVYYYNTFFIWRSRYLRAPTIFVVVYIFVVRLILI